MSELENKNIEQDNVINDLDNKKVNQSEYNSKINDLEIINNRQDTQISQMIQNPGTATEGNSELIDIRIGYDGKTYSTAGEHIRSIEQGESFKHNSIKPESIHYNISEYFNFAIEDLFEEGGFNSETGENIGTSNRTRMKNFFILENKDLLIDISNNYSWIILLKNKNGEIIGYPNGLPSSWINGKKIISNVYSFRILINSSNININDIFIGTTKSILHTVTSISEDVTSISEDVTSISEDVTSISEDVFTLQKQRNFYLFQDPQFKTTDIVIDDNSITFKKGMFLWSVNPCILENNLSYNYSEDFGKYLFLCFNYNNNVDNNINGYYFKTYSLAEYNFLSREDRKCLLLNIGRISNSGNLNLNLEFKNFLNNNINTDTSNLNKIIGNIFIEPFLTGYSNNIINIENNIFTIKKGTFIFSSASVILSNDISINLDKNLYANYHLFLVKNLSATEKVELKFLSYSQFINFSQEDISNILCYFGRLNSAGTLNLTPYFDFIINNDKYSSSSSITEEDLEIIKNKIETIEDQIDKNYLNYNTYNIITVGKNKDYTNLMDAINACRSLATYNNRYEIQLYDNIYVTQAEEYFNPYWSSTVYCVFCLEDYIKIRGMGEKKIIYAELPSTGFEQSEYAQYQTGYVNGNAELENVHIIAKNIRYAIHYEQGGGEKNKDKTWISKNCIFEHLGCEDVDVYKKWYQPDAVGCGTSSGSQHIFENCSFYSISGCYRMHTNHDFENPTRVSFINCNFILTKESYQQWRNGSLSTYNSRCLLLDDLGSKVKRYYNFEGCTFTDKITDSSGAYLNEEITNIFPCCEYHGHGNSPFYWDHSVSGYCLKITSNITGNSSKVEVIEDTTGLLGEVTQRPGSAGLAGYLYGNIELRMSLKDGSVPTYIINRLGDCSVVNKILKLNIDGEEVTLTFNENYLLKTESLSEGLTVINNLLQNKATASYYNPHTDYFPEFEDVLYEYRNINQSTPILKGSFVKQTGFKDINYSEDCRNFYNYVMAIEDIPINNFGRTVKNTILSKNNSIFTPLFNTEEDKTFSEGQLFTITSSGKLSKTEDFNNAVYKALSDIYIINIMK